MTTKKTAKPRPRNYFVKDDGEIFVVKDAFFEDVESREEALHLALEAWFELLEQLSDDGMAGANSLIGNMKVTTGLERTLAKLDEKYPGLLVQMRSVERRANGFRINVC